VSLKNIDFDPVTAVHLPLTERVLDRLADMLFASDEILDMIRTREIRPDETTIAVENTVRRVYNQINDLMKTMSD
jgi:hypothetical protein